MYSVNGIVINSYLEAVKQAKLLNADVIQVDNGIRRWTPPAPVSSKKMRQYLEQKNAYEAQQRMLNK